MSITIIAEKEKIRLEDALLSIDIDGKWTSFDFIWLLCFIEELELYIGRTKRMIKIKPFKIKRTYTGMEQVSGRIPVKQIQYASPGVVELILSASVVTGIVTLLKHYVPNWKNKAEIKKMNAELIKIEIDNLKKMGFTDDEIQQVLRPQVNRIFGYLSHIEDEEFKGSVNQVKVIEINKK